MFNELWRDEEVVSYEKHNIEMLFFLYFGFFCLSLYLIYTAFFWFFFFVLFYFYRSKNKTKKINSLQLSKLTFLKRYYI